MELRCKGRCNHCAELERLESMIDDLDNRKTDRRRPKEPE